MTVFRDCCYNSILPLLLLLSTTVQPLCMYCSCTAVAHIVRRYCRLYFLLEISGISYTPAAATLPSPSLLVLVHVHKGTTLISSIL